MPSKKIEVNGQQIPNQWIWRLKKIQKPLNLIECSVLYCLSKLMNSKATYVSVDEIKKSREKDIVFIMGSGSSVNDISKEEWKHISEFGDTFSFNYFFRGMFVPITYHISGEISEAHNYGPILISSNARKNIKSYYSSLFNNPFYKDTIYFLRYKTKVINIPISVATWALYFLKAFENRRICLYEIDQTKKLPSDSIHSITHQEATLSDAINISYILGYSKIVLVGVDLYDKRYFWVKEGETRESNLKKGKKYSGPHKTADRMVKVMNEWSKYLNKKNVKLYVYNPQSLLGKVLPVYNLF